MLVLELLFTEKFRDVYDFMHFINLFSYLTVSNL